MRYRIPLPLFLFATVLTLFLISGCSLYVNIPEQSGDVARNDPNLKAVGKAQEAALHHLYQQRSFTQPVQIMLPEGTTPETYQAMMAQIGELATYNLDAARDDMPTLEVKRVLIRHPFAEIDVSRPAFANEPLGPTELVTVYMKWGPFTQWRIERVRVWQMTPSTPRNLSSPNP